MTSTIRYLALGLAFAANLSAWALDTSVPVLQSCLVRRWPMAPAGQATSITDSKVTRYWTPRRDLTLACVPYLAIGFITRSTKEDVRKVNLDINAGFHSHVDDYLQYAPLAVTYGLKVSGYEGRSKWGRLLVSNALSAGIMAVLVNGLKYSVRDERPDGSSANSFPSGHTATAFMAATILHKEYGLTRSLWYSVGGYTVATGIGVYRVMNNRHWVSDVMAGAGIGILSTELGYAVSDLIFKDKHTIRREMEALTDMDEHPSFFSLQAGLGITMANMDAPEALTTAGGPSRLKMGLGTVIAAEAAYFLNPYFGLGLRGRINSATATLQWQDGSRLWTSGTLPYNAATGRYEHPSAASPDYRQGSEAGGEQLSSFDVMGGFYGRWPLSRRWSLGGKLLFGYRHSGRMWFWADKSGWSTNAFPATDELAKAMASQRTDQASYDYVQSLEVKGGNSFITGTGIHASYALKHNVVWRLYLDYDYTRNRCHYDYHNVSLADEANRQMGLTDGIPAGKSASGHLNRPLHQLTLGAAVCYSF